MFRVLNGEIKWLNGQDMIISISIIFPAKTETQTRTETQLIDRLQNKHLVLFRRYACNPYTTNNKILIETILVNK